MKTTCSWDSLWQLPAVAFSAQVWKQARLDTPSVPAMPGPPYNEGGDPSWALWRGTAATSSASAAAAPWPSSAPVAVSGVQPAGPWAAALPQMTTPAAGVQQTAVGVASAGQGQAAVASQPVLAAAGVCEPAAASATVVPVLTKWSRCGEHYIFEWQYDDSGWWANYTRDFSDRLEEWYQDSKGQSSGASRAGTLSSPTTSRSFGR